MGGAASAGPSFFCSPLACGAAVGCCSTALAASLAAGGNLSVSVPHLRSVNGVAVPLSSAWRNSKNLLMISKPPRESVDQCAAKILFQVCERVLQ